MDSSAISSVKSIIEEVRVKLFDADLENKSDNIADGIKDCDKYLRQFNALLANSKSVGEKQHFIASIGQIKTFKEMFRALQIMGGGYAPRKLKNASDNVKWEDGPSAFKERIKTGFILNLKHSDPKLFLNDAKAIFQRRMLNVLKKEQAVKANAVFCGEFKMQLAGEEVEEFKYLATKNSTIWRDTNLESWFIENMEQPLLVELEEFQERNSGWALSSITNLQININKYTPQNGSSYIESPQQIKKKHACINVRNVDDMCFAWAVTSALYPAASNKERTSSYPDPKTVLDLKDTTFPMTIKQIPRFERQNKISINVYILKKGKNGNFITLPTYLTNEKLTKHVNILMIQNAYCAGEDIEDASDDDVNELKYHFIWIKHLSRLLSNQLGTRHGKKYFCDRCLHYFYCQSKLNAHYEDCKNMNYCKVRLPDKTNKFLSFKNFSHKIKAPFVIYADLECILKACKDKSKYQDHIPCSIAYYVKCSYDDSLSFYKSYRGADCIQWFTKELENFAEDLETVFLCPLPMDPLTDGEKRAFAKAQICHICEKQIKDEGKKVRDHDHFTAKYRGSACADCNVNFKDSHTVPVVFHNLSGYDSHFIISDLALSLEGRVDLLPINKERYISFTKHLDGNLVKYRFIDSFRFMDSGLDTLASYLKEYPILTAEFRNLASEKVDLLKRKGIYPYDHIDSEERFAETQLPKISKFYNKLTDSNVSAEDYEHAQKVWNNFEINNLGEYSDLYLKTDVLLLADVFEQFRTRSHATYGLDPAHYFTVPGYTWDCALRHTTVELELLTDIDMVMFIERGIRGGLSQCSKRYSKANNKYFPENYNSAEPSKYLTYMDINNQYGWAMSQYLPYGGFKWLNDAEISTFNVNAVDDEAAEGCILEVSLGYPEELHDKHSDLPFCPEHRHPPSAKNVKLLATLYDKERYIIHYRNLKQAIAHGLKLTHIHRILSFKQSPWLKPYIDLNTALRAAAANDFEKNLFKLMNNAVFGKTIENIRKRSIVKLIRRWEGRYGAKNLIAKPEFKSCTVFTENLVAIELNMSEIYFNKPIYVGMCILDISKIKIYDFHYGYMKGQFGDACKALYTDTDSLIYEVMCEDLYEVIQRDCHKYFDTSDYPPNNKWGIPLVNKKVLGLMKDEMNGRIMTEFVGLRSKMYAIRVEGKDGVKKSKGVKRYIVKNKITFDDYINCLNNNAEKTVTQNLIGSSNHKVASITQTKIALSPHDDKRWLNKGDYETLPHGHYSIMSIN